LEAEVKKQFALALFLFAASLTTAAAETWPARPVKVIVGFAAGGPTDLFARLIAQKLSEQTGKNFYIENVSGAPKQFVRFSDAGHEEVDMYGAQNAVRAFLVPPSPEAPHGSKPVTPHL
jgi:hypothetical protein